MNVADTSTSRTDERDRLEGEFAASFSNERLHLILLPTEQCNFRCTYCYEDFSIGRMPPDVSDGVKRFIDRRIDDLRSLRVSWFGGEPLLALSVIEDISSHIVGATARRTDLIYESDMTTNGYRLDLMTVERLTKLGIKMFQISLDGPQDFHDQTRVRANGKASFDQIWSNLLEIRKSCIDVLVLLRIHLTPENSTAAPRFLEEVREAFLVDDRFQVLLKPIERMGGRDDERISVIAHNDRPPLLQALEAIVRLGSARNVVEGDTICYAARANSLMIRADGRIGKCTVALNYGGNTIGQLLPDGSLRIDNAMLRPWLRGWPTGDTTTLACPYNRISDK